MRTSGIVSVVIFALCLTVLAGCGENKTPPGENLGNPMPGTANQKPVSVISPATEQSVFVGDNISFSGRSSYDPDSVAPLIYQWTFTGAATSLQSSAAAVPGRVFFSAPGKVTVSLVVTDNQGMKSGATSITVNVFAVGTNLAPDGSIRHDKGNGSTGSTGDINITTGATVVFTGYATDPEGDAINYSWLFEGASASSTTGSGPINVRYDTVGTFLVKLVVSDSNGNPDLAPAMLTVAVSSALPAFRHLSVLTDADGNPGNGTATYTLTVEDNVNVNVATPEGNWITPMMRYNGLQLPPVIIAKRGTQMTLNVQNNLAEETTIHWHGFQIPGDQDGGPDSPIAAGTAHTYNFKLVQPAGPLWFHPHADGTTATQVYYGLAGGFIITDDITESLENNKQLPAGSYDIPLLIQDRRFASDNGNGVRDLVYQPGMGGNMGAGMGGGMTDMAGMLGDHILVNGVEMPALKVATHQYRFRLFNGSNARTFDFALGNNATFTVVATDGGLLNSPVVTNHIMLGAGERAEIVVDFGNYTVGDRITLTSQAFNTGTMGGGAGLLPNGAAFEVMRFDIENQVTDDVVLYTSLPASAEINNRLTASDADTTRNFIMSMAMGTGGMQFLINGRSFDMNRIDEQVPSGATEIWNISNTSGMAHPFHAHAIQWQVLDRNGVPASEVDLGWKDTVLVQPGENARLVGHFDPEVNRGLYMYHCHILEHEATGMMGMFEVQQ